MISKKLLKRKGFRKTNPSRANTDRTPKTCCIAFALASVSFIVPYRVPEEELG